MRWSDWQKEINHRKRKVLENPGDLNAAMELWDCVSGEFRYNCASSQWVLAAFRECALKDDKSLLILTSAFRELSESSGEYPNVELFDDELRTRIETCTNNHPDILWLRTILRQG